MKTQSSNVAAPIGKIAKALAPMALMSQAVQLDSQANVQEVAHLIQQALSTTEQESEIHTEVQHQLEEQIKTVEQADLTESTKSKLGFLQKTVSLDCFFGSSDCLFKDKKSMEAGEVTEFAKKKIEQANHNDAANILAQVKNEVNAMTDKHKHADKEKHLHKQLHDSVQGLMKLNDKEAHKTPSNNVLSMNSTVGATEFLVHAPIDEVNPISVKLEPTFARDTVMSARVGAFRKVVGYDTFDSILKQERDEIKDPNDYYNVTINMMIKRTPNLGPNKVLDKWNGGELITPKLDKGFPYDDGDNTISDKVKGPAASSDKGKPAGKLNGENITTGDLKNLIIDKAVPLTESTFVLLEGDGDNVFKLMDSNVTKGQMKNLITDKPAPITVQLAQTSGDGDNVFKLMDSNVTKGQMKNLITDKPAPITVKLAQTSGDGDNVFKLMDSNVTKGQMKNLITDKPAPITVKLAQIEGDGDNVFQLMDSNVTKGQMKNLITDKPAPITVKLAQVEGDGDNVFQLMDSNVTKGQMKNLITDKPAPITVKLAQTSGDGDNVFKLMDSNVTKGQMKNLITDKPAPITVQLAQVNGDGDNVFKLMDSNVTKGQMKNLITDKPAPITVKLAQVSNPVVNPPFNNWSVNQPTVDHASGDPGDQDLGLKNIVIEGVNGYDLVQTSASTVNPVVNPPFNNWSVNQPSVPHDSGLAGNADLGQNIIVDGHPVHFAQAEHPTNLVQIVPQAQPVTLVQLEQVENAPGVFIIKDQDQPQSLE